LSKQQSALIENTQHTIIGFLFPLEVQKHHLIAYFLSNASGKNYQNRLMYIEVIESQSIVFLDTVLSSFAGW